MNEKNVKRYSLSKQVADELEKMIEDGHYKIGEKIPPEAELMELFNVSRNTLREAIQSMTSAGILVVRQGDGTYVKSTNRFNGCMHLKYEQVSPEDIRETRKALEITIAHLAAERRTDKELERIKTALDCRKNCNSTERENTQADIDFHLAIAGACHNTILQDLYESIAAFIVEHISLRNEKTDMDSAQIDALHEDLYAAIAKGDPIKAKTCVSKILKI